MAEGSTEERDNSEYKDHYKRILIDLIGKRNSAGILENEEAIEGTASNSLLEIGDQTMTAGSSQEERVGIMSSTTARCRNLTSSLNSTLMDSTDDGLSVFHKKVSTPKPGNGTACPTLSDNQLTNDRKSPEGDLPPPVRTAAPEAGLKLTPEPSLMSVGEEQQESSPDDGASSGKQQKKKWKIFKGFKNSPSPK